jgi:opacity protein-like surface antigen
LGLLAVPQSGRGQGFYVNGGVGAALSEDVDLNRFVVPTPGGEIKLHPGPRFSVAGGYNFNDYVGAQLESGFIFNDVKSISGARRVDAGLGHAPLLGDLVLRYDQPDCKWVHYVGAGLGGDVSVISLDHVVAPNGRVVDGSDGDVVFAWQAFAGVRYKFTESISAGAGYKYFAADGASWDVRHTSRDISTDTARVHTLLVDFTFKF